MTGEPRIRVLADAGATSRAAAKAIARALRDAVEQRGRADWATTGGSTPIGIYRALVAPQLRATVPWDRVHVWWGDDRFVPRDDPLSNALPFDRELLPNVPLPAANVHVMPMGTGRTGAGHGAGRAAAAAAAVARAYEGELRSEGLDVADSGFPILDVVLVGIGGDGHVLSAFPGSALFDSVAWVDAVPAPTHIEPHVERVSLNPGVLAAARLALLVAHGDGKAAILASVLGPERDERRWPAQVARRAGALWLLDRAAARHLPR